jgi:hypothetical protein
MTEDEREWEKRDLAQGRGGGKETGEWKVAEFLKKFRGRLAMACPKPSKAVPDFATADSWRLGVLA